MGQISALKKNQLENNGFSTNYNRTFSTQSDNGEVISQIDDTQNTITTNTNTVVNVATNDINNNTDSSVSTSEGNINTNTTTAVNELKPTPNKMKNSVTYGNTYQTVLSISGEGLLQQAYYTISFTHGGNFNSVFGYKITVDGNVVFEETSVHSGSGTSENYTFSGGMGNIGDNTYSILNNGGYNSIVSSSPSDRLMNYYFKTSIVIEVYSNTDAYTTRSNYYKNIYSLYQ